MGKKFPNQTDRWDTYHKIKPLHDKIIYAPNRVVALSETEMWFLLALMNAASTILIHNLKKSEPDFLRAFTIADKMETEHE